MAEYEPHVLLALEKYNQIAARLPKKHKRRSRAEIIAEKAEITERRARREKVKALQKRDGERYDARESKIEAARDAAEREWLKTNRPDIKRLLDRHEGCLPPELGHLSPRCWHNPTIEEAAEEAAKDAAAEAYATAYIEVFTDGMKQVLMAQYATIDPLD
ncbi:hypothetical protein ABIB06_002454 [Bradyrhizobium sp. LB8.2]|uniref:hypothetical protein n=1 Tax=unclassified Bradyrhizobium TaxID=2631580 RepID=UPI003391F27D